MLTGFSLTLRSIETKYTSALWTAAPNKEKQNLAAGQVINEKPLKSQCLTKTIVYLVSVHYAVMETINYFRKCETDFKSDFAHSVIKAI